eukprot:jgi/Mesen1/7788/ME000408S06899
MWYPRALRRWWLRARYWVSASEKEGKSPFQTLLPYVAILGLLTPFIILGIAYSMGAIKLPNY